MASLTTHERSPQNAPRLVYRIDCQNPGCRCKFDLSITPLNASLLSGTLTCPRCHRRGGILKPCGRLGARLFAAKLVFRTANIADPRQSDEDDVLAEMMMNARLN